MAERQGFEPWMGYKPMPVFKTGAFNRSATSPYCARVCLNSLQETRLAWQYYDNSGDITPLFFLEIMELYPHYIYQ